jgi:hypothetical protein
VKATIKTVRLFLFLGALICFPKEITTADADVDPSIRAAELKEQIEEIHTLLETLPEPHQYGTPLLSALNEAQQHNAEYIRQELGDIYIEIAKCESGLNQFNPDGTPLISPTRDVGVMQINLAAHGATAEKLGIDIYTLKGNVEYAKILKAQSGTQPWYMSRHCHGY